VKKFFGKLGNFLTGLRVLTVNIFTLLFLVYLVGGAIYLVNQLPEKVDPDGKVLILNPVGIIQDQEVFASDLGFPFSMSDGVQIQSRDLIRLIRAAADDERLSGVLVDFSGSKFAGSSTALRISDELAAFRTSGKSVVAYSESLTTGSYLMAAQADEIFLHPSGALAVNGVGGYRDYTRELTDKLKITIHNYSQGEFKSAVEGFTRSDMSEPDRLQREALYGPVWATLKSRMAQAREVEPEIFQQLADQYSVPMINEGSYDGLAWAQQQGIISGTKSFPELRSHMIEKFGKSDDETVDTYPHIYWSEYLSQVEREEVESENAVAVVFVQGAIVHGEGGPGVAGSDDIAPLIRRAHEDDSTKAIVLRVNSPGGSIIGSDIIRDELVAAKVKGIPVVISMGDVAASGGVWVSTPADTIYAEPTTITGSIGVAVAFPTLENVFDYVGVNFDGVTTSENAGWGVYKGVNEKLDAIFARWANSAYEQFIGLVAASRNREPDYIRSIAGGRVWLAPDALERGLIDKLGNMEEAIADAAQLAGLQEYKTHYVVQEVSPVMALLRQLSSGLTAQASSSYNVFARRMTSLMAMVKDISEPKATVMCSSCLIELL
jgi:protease-4